MHPASRGLGLFQVRAEACDGVGKDAAQCMLGREGRERKVKRKRRQEKKDKEKTKGKGKGIIIKKSKL